MKKLFIALCLILIFCLCGYLLHKTPKKSGSNQNEVEQVVEQRLPDTLFTLNKDTLQKGCSVDNVQLCAVEQTIKCTINPDFDNCQEEKNKGRIPQFVFITDSGTDRPTEISYKFTDKKNLNNQTVEYYTDSTCNGTWFGLCHGRIIYVLAPDSEGWSVKDVYAIEQ